MKTGSLYAERPHLSLDKRHCHTRVICELLIAAPGEVGSWKPSPDVHVQRWVTKTVLLKVWVEQQWFVAQYMYTMHTYGYRFIILPNSCFCKSTNNCNELWCSYFPRKFHKWNWLKAGISSLIALESETQVEVRAWLVPSGGFGYELALKSLS